jgi:hypothetical protein
MFDQLMTYFLKYNFIILAMFRVLKLCLSLSHFKFFKHVKSFVLALLTKIVEQLNFNQAYMSKMVCSCVFYFANFLYVAQIC